MNLLLKKAAAVLISGVMAVSAIGAECVAESANAGYGYVSLAKEAVTVAKPTYQVKGTPGKRKIALSTTTAGATIYYTANGKTPTTSSRKYTGALLLITKTTKIKAIAVKDGVASKVMTKTFNVNTLYGDVTGDGNINQNDYTKLKNFLALKTKYICKDNADCNGDGKISSKDLTVLSQYLSGRITRLPSDPIVSISKPTGSISSVYGGKTVELACATSGASIYYTTNGTTPSTSSMRYTSKITIDKSCTVQAVAYKDGEYSEIRSFSVTVGDLGTVSADKVTTTNYTTELPVTLSCGSSGAKIYYTTDGSDPRTSNSVAIFSSAIKLNKDTVIKAYARALGYADTPVETFVYKVTSAFTISGTVWDDTPGASTISNGIRAINSEPGISGINVYLINSTTAVKDTSVYYIQKAVTDSNGKYSFPNLIKGMSYKVVFEYNYQKYRAYNAIVAGGSQALPMSIDAYTIKPNGTYVTVNSVDTFTNAVVKYSDAINYNSYLNYAVTPSSYTETTENVDLALISKNYGQLDLTVAVSGHNTTNNTIKNGEKITYLFTLTNNSPMTINTLSEVELGVYLPLLSNDTHGIEGNVPHNIFNHGEDSRNYPGYTYWTVSFKLGNGLAPGKTATVSFEGTVNSDVGTKLECFGQVNSYRFANSCYDYYSLPGNLTYNATRALEKDECRAQTITVTSGSSATSAQTISSPRSRIVMTRNESTAYNALEVVVKNSTSIRDVIIGSQTGTAAVFNYNYTTSGGDLYIYFDVTPGGQAGTVSIPVYLASDTTKYVNLTINVS